MERVVNLTKICEHLEAPTDGVDLLYFIVYGLLMTFFIAVGFIGNVLATAVFAFSTHWVCINYYLIALALADTTLLLSAFVQWSLWALLTRGHIPVVGDHVTILYVSYISTNVSLTLCVWLIVALSIERFISIKSPIRYRTLNNARRAKLVLTAISAGAVVANLGRFVELELTSFACPSGSIRLIRTTELRSNSAYFLVYHVIGSLLVVNLLPCCVLVVLTAHMHVALRRAGRVRVTLMASENNSEEQSRKGSSTAAMLLRSAASCHTLPANVLSPLLIPRRSISLILDATATPVSASFRRFASTRHRAMRRDDAMNRILVVVLVKFVICYTLPTVNDVLELTLEHDAYQRSALMQALVAVSNCLVVLNSAANFYIYAFTSEWFRRQLRRIVRRIIEFRCRRQPSVGTMFRCKSPLVVVRRPHSCPNFRVGDQGRAACRKSTSAVEQFALAWAEITIPTSVTY